MGWTTWLGLTPWVVLVVFCCQTPPGELIPTWNVMVAITVATIISDPLVSSIQLPLYSKYLLNFTNHDFAVDALLLETITGLFDFSWRLFGVHNSCSTSFNQNFLNFQA